MTYTEQQQRELDQRSGAELDKIVPPAVRIVEEEGGVELRVIGRTRFRYEVRIDGVLYDLDYNYRTQQEALEHGRQAAGEAKLRIEHDKRPGSGG